MEPRFLNEATWKNLAKIRAAVEHYDGCVTGNNDEWHLGGVVQKMRWEEVRKIYPDRFVKIQVLESHIKDNVKYINDVAVIKAFADSKEATKELVRAKDDVLIYHTSNEEIAVKIKPILGYRGGL